MKLNKLKQTKDKRGNRLIYKNKKKIKIKVEPKEYENEIENKNEMK